MICVANSAGKYDVVDITSEKAQMVVDNFFVGELNVPPFTITVMERA